MKGFRLGFGALLGVFLLSNVSAWAAAGSFLVVSDIDDTVKRTDVLHKGSALAHMFVEPVFAGMPELYQGLVENSKAAGGSPVLGRSLVFLSGSPTFLRHSLKDGLEERGFPAATYVLMNWFHELNTEVFKRRIMGWTHPGSQNGFSEPEWSMF
ncbi:phosphatase domain-containing protein [Bdellovibrionota bacterium FG-2]